MLYPTPNSIAMQFQGGHHRAPGMFKVYGNSPSSFVLLSLITLLVDRRLEPEEPLSTLYGLLLCAKLFILDDLDTTRFLLLGVAGAVVNSERLVDATVPTRLEGAVRIVPSLPLRLLTLWEDARERLRGVTGVLLEEASSSMSLSSSISRFDRTAGLSADMVRSTSANCFMRSRNCSSLSGRAPNLAYSYAERKSVAVGGDVRTPMVIK
jgi:hypothetical protein